MSPNGRGHGAVAFAFVAFVVAGGLAIDHGLGIRAPAATPASTTDSGAWLCPHSGGQGWEGRLYLANPGSAPSTVRVSALSAKGSSAVGTMTVDPGTTTEVTVPATAREASTYVEYFGGWIAAGWLTVSSASQGTGVAAEPCAPSTDSRTWYTANGSTPKGAGADVIIMNPYGANAIFDVVLFAADRAPVRQSDVQLKPHRSMIVSIQDVFPLEPAVGSEIDVHAGRVGVASVDTSAQNGVGSVLGSTSPVSSLTTPLLGGSGQRSVSVTAPGTEGIRFDGTDLAANVTHPPGLSDAPQDPQTAQSYPVTTAGASGLRLVGQQGTGGSFVASVSSLGEGTDFASTGGAPAAGPAWIVLPTVAGDPSKPGLVITDPGTEGATVTLHVLAADGPNDVTIDVAAGSSVDVPAAFLSADETAGILVTSTGGAVIPAGASESLGMHGIAGYAIAVGIPLPNPPLPNPG
jgi:hypothetical protein